MHKRKDGKIIASLTEVKNKTGDIFALVDEFGEVTLTSYNKPKYRIVKVDIFETLKLEEEKKKEVSNNTVVSKTVEKKSVIKKVKEKFSNGVTPSVTTTGLEYSFSEVAVTSFKKLAAWDRNSRSEKALAVQVKKQLQ